MSYNQSRPDKSDNQYGRSTGYHQQQQPQRSSTVGYGRGAGTAAPSINVDLSLSSDRSFKKPSNAQGWHQPRVNHSVPSNHNGPNVQSCFQGDSGEPVTGGLANPSSGAIPKAPTLQSPTMNTPKDVQVEHIPPTSHMQNSPVSNIRIPSLQTPFQHTQVPHPMHFGGPNMHMQPPNVAPTSFQMPITLSVGNTPEIQQHPMHHLGMMHQAQGHGLSTSMGAQIHLQMGHVGVSASHHEHDSYPTPEKVMDRQRSSGRSDLLPSNMVVDDRWAKNHGSHPAGYEGNLGFRPGQGGNSGVLRNPGMQGPIMSRPMQHVGPMGDMGRYTPDLEMWQRGPNFQQKGLFPSLHTPMQVMHKAERKYQVCTIVDEEQAKQRQLKGILNKLTPQNFEKLLEQVKSVNIDNAVTLGGVISQIFDKALMEPSFGEMYAELCFHLSGALPDFNEDGEKITFKRLLINKCQEEFERGEKEEEEASRVAEEGQTEEEREEKRLKVRRRKLCNIRFIGELYKKRMLTEKIMHTCIQKLLGCDQEDPHEENIEALCILMSTIGVTIDHHKAKVHMDAYFERMKMLSCKQELSSRARFMLMNAIDLRKNKWQERMNVEGPIPDTVTSVSETANSLLTGFQPAKETIDVNGFDVFPSQVESVSHIFRRQPDIALGFRPKNLQIKRAYMNELLILIEMLCQPPKKLSEDDLSNADDTLADLIDVGFKLDWLKTKLSEVSEKKKKEQSSEARLRTMEEQLQKLKLMFLDLETQLQKEKAEALAANAPLSFNDVV